MKTITLLNDQISLEMSEDFGGKLVSIKDDTGFEFLFQSPVETYRTPKQGEAFADYDPSGLDECFPTIDECQFADIHYPDHGDIWPVAWVHKKKDGILRSKVHSQSTGLLFRRQIQLVENTIHLEYSVENPSDSEKYYLRAQHGLLDLKEDMQLLLPYPQSSALNVIDGEDYPFDITALSKYPEGDCYKFYNRFPLEGGSCEVLYPLHNRSLRFKFDPEKLPYLGVWITTGGFHGHRNLAIEPSNGFYDAVDRAVENGLKPIEVGQIHSWTIQIEVRKEDGDGRTQIQSTLK